MASTAAGRALTLLIVLAPFVAGCASTGSTTALPEPFPTSGRADPVDRAAVPALVSTALSLRGTPYRNGGTTLAGFDCSGFTQFVFARYGVRLPREVRDQYRLGESVSKDETVPGDLLFFTTTAPGASHVGIVIGHDEFVHAPSDRGVVRVERLSLRYWTQRFIGARRLRLADAH